MSSFLQVSVALLVVVNPVSAALAARALGEGRGRRERAVIVLAAAALGAAVLVGLAVVADSALDALDISVPSAQLAAGIVLLVPALELLVAGPDEWVHAAPNTPPARLGVFPLGFPVIASPWAMVSVLAFASDEGAGAAAGAAAVAVIAAAALAAGFVGPADRHAVRLVGALLGVATTLIAVDLIRDGVFAT